MVGEAGLEPTTCRSSGGCSTFELLPRNWLRGRESNPTLPRLMRPGRVPGTPRRKIGKDGGPRSPNLRVWSSALCPLELRPHKLRPHKYRARKAPPFERIFPRVMLNYIQLSKRPEMAPREGIAPPTRGSSNRRSTPELPRQKPGNTAVGGEWRMAPGEGFEPSTFPFNRRSLGR